MVSISKVIYQVSSTVQALVKLRKPGLQHIPHRWPDLLNMLETYTPKLEVHKVIWEFSIEEWLKVNTDGASRGNPGRSSIGFCMRNELGYVVYACGKEVQETTNTIVEAMAMVEALRYCSQHNITQFCLQTYSMMLKKYGNHLG